VNRIAKEVVEQLRPAAASKGRPGGLLDEKIPDQHLDPVKVRRALLHLPERNPLLAGQEPRLDLRVARRPRAHRDADHGPMLETEATSRVFELHNETEIVTKRQGRPRLRPT
jgi:hypothetical protein